MRTLELVITLQDDCIFSERNATAGAHQALDYIPGGALLGAAAARLYTQLTSQAAFDWFHAGKVRFSNAYPLTTDGQRTFPMPACWHQAKGKSPIKDNQLDATQVWRLDKCEGKLPENQQPQQLRAGYLSLNGQVAETHKSFRMKTAIDADSGRAKESALFGYDALQAGQRFYAQVSFDDDFTEADIAKLKTVLTQTLLLGRSRSAEYGRATVDILKTPQTLSTEKTTSKEITLWLLSDLMALDEYGQPTLSPNAENLGLPKGKLLAEKSFLRTRRYSTWNAHKQGYDMERQVISKGSVLVYQLESVLTAEHINKIAAGLGVERQAGLGQVWLNPALLANQQPTFEASAPLADKPKGLSKPAKEPELIAWLRKQNTDQSSKQNFARETKRIARGYGDLMQSARDLKGLDPNVPIGPSHSQWGAVLAAAKSQRELATFMNAPDGSFKSRGEGWKDEFWQDKEQKMYSFYDWFKAEYIKQQNAQFIQHLVREIMSALKDNKGGHA
jgi:hypothetical protein